MNTYRDDHSQEPFSTTVASSAKPWAAEIGSGGVAMRPLPAACKRLATGVRGTWLYRIGPAGREGTYWAAEMMLSGKMLQRRFASELHARAWLTVVKEPRVSTFPFDLEEHSGLFRKAARLCAGWTQAPAPRQAAR